MTQLTFLFFRWPRPIGLLLPLADGRTAPRSGASSFASALHLWQALMMVIFCDHLGGWKNAGWNYPGVRREPRSVWGIGFPYRFPSKWGAVRSYLEFPNHLLGNDENIVGLRDESWEIIWTNIGFECVEFILSSFSATFSAIHGISLSLGFMEVLAVLTKKN